MTDSDSESIGALLALLQLLQHEVVYGLSEVFKS
jgi:hypothetical protein